MSPHVGSRGRRHHEALSRYCPPDLRHPPVRIDPNSLIGRIITTHILPNATAPVLVYSTIAVGTIIAAEATLSFLGIGLQKPSISWGLQINDARQFVRTSPFLRLIPSAFLSVTVLCFIMLGDALRDALDPKLR